MGTYSNVKSTYKGIDFVAQLRSFGKYWGWPSHSVIVERTCKLSEHVS